VGDVGTTAMPPTGTSENAAVGPTLDQIKADKRLAKMVLVNNSRLSVQPVTDDEWRIVCDLGGVEP